MSDPVAQLVAERKAQGLSQREIAERMESTPSVISELERGVTDPHLSTLFRYARALGLQMRAYIGVAQEPQIGSSVRGSDDRVWTRVEDDSVGAVWQRPDGLKCVWGYLWDHYRPLELA